MGFFSVRNNTEFRVQGGTSLEIKFSDDSSVLPPPVPTPTLPADAAIWLDASNSAKVLDGSGNPCALDAPVATWLDTSTNNRNFTQENSSYRPVLTAYRGMNYIKFTAANFTALTGNANALTFTNGVSGVTLIAVTQFGNSNLTPLVSAESVFANSVPPPGNTLSSRIKFMTNPANVDPVVNDRGRYFSAGGRRLDSDVQDGGAPSSLDTATEKNYTAPGVMVATIDYVGAFSTTTPPSGTVALYFNGLTAGSDPAFQTAGNVSSTNAAKAGIGRRFIANTPFYHNGVIGEFVAYERILTPTELTNAYLYLSNKWSIIP